LNAGGEASPRQLVKGCCTSAGNDGGKTNVCTGQIMTVPGIDLGVLDFVDSEALIVIRHLLNQSSSSSYHL
jgi:hypothetical protein